MPDYTSYQCTAGILSIPMFCRTLPHTHVLHDLATYPCSVGPYPIPMFCKTLPHTHVLHDLTSWVIPMLCRTLPHTHVLHYLTSSPCPAGPYLIPMFCKTLPHPHVLQDLTSYPCPAGPYHHTREWHNLIPCSAKPYMSCSTLPHFLVLQNFIMYWTLQYQNGEQYLTIYTSFFLHRYQWFITLATYWSHCDVTIMHVRFILPLCFSFVKTSTETTSVLRLQVNIL